MKRTLLVLVLGILFPAWIFIPSNAAVAIRPEAVGEADISQANFFDNFEDGVADGWSPQTPSRWEVVSDQGDFSYHLRTPDPTGNEFSTIAGRTFGNFEMTLQLRSGDSSGRNVFIRFDVQTHPNGYYLQFGEAATILYLVTAGPGSGVEIARNVGYTLFNDNQYHTIRIVRQGINIKVYGDGTQIFDLNNGTYLSGQVDIGSFKGTAYFDNINITDIPPPANFFDNFEDGVADGWTPLTPSRWEVVADQGDFSYHLRTPATSGDEYSVIANRTFSDFDMTLQLRSGDNAARNVFVLFDMQTYPDGYYLQLGQSATILYLTTAGPGTGVEIARNDGFTIDNQYHTIRIVRQGVNLKVYGDARLVLDMNHGAFLSGQIALGSFKGTAFFDDVNIIEQPTATPNLTATSLSFNPAAVNAGGTIALTGTAVNNGNGSTGAGFKVNFYLSSSANAPDLNLLLHSFTMSALGAGQSRPFNETGAVPANAAPGQYYVWVSVDHDNAIAESNEGDNQLRASSQLTVQPRTQPLQLTFNQIDAGKFPTIENFATVTDGAGNPITGLTVSNFTVREDGQTESPITVMPLGGGGVPISAALVIDRSGSMVGQPLQDAKNAAATFVNQLANVDRAAVISFSTAATVDQPFTSTKSLLINAINALVASGGTAIYDAVVTAVNQTNTQTGRKAVILMTDGENNSGTSTLQNAINVAVQFNIPVFAIGLNVGRGSAAELALQQIANSTGGGYYYAPTSSDLQQIYQLISQQLQNQYKITYTTHNLACDGTTRTVQIMVNYQGNTDTKSRTYIAPLINPVVPIAPVASSPQMAGTEFWVDIMVGDNNNPVANLFGASLILNFNSNVLDVVTPYSTTVVPGSFLGSDVVFQSNVDESAGKVGLGIARKAGQGGVNGSGVILRVRFFANANTPNGTQVQFSLSEVTAIDPNGAPITLNPLTLTITINSGVTVWPGDTNNDGIVNQADVLPIGLHWNRTGPARVNASLAWIGQPATAWSPETATHADANGDGTVNQADVLPIGLNWGRTHTAFPAQPLGKGHFAFSAALAPEVNSAPMPGEEFFIRAKLAKAANLFGLAFELRYDQPGELQILSVEPDEDFGMNALFYSKVDPVAGKIAIGISRKAGQERSQAVVSAVRIKAKLSANARLGETIDLVLQNVVANTADGQPIEVQAQSARLKIGATTTVNADNAITDYRLEQNVPNPFNPSTVIRYELPEAVTVMVKVFNTNGQEVRTLVNGLQPAGAHQVSWDGRDAKGEGVPSGLYLYRLQAGSHVETRRMMLVR